jgi:serine protease
MKKTIGIVMVLLMLMSVTGALADVNKDAQPDKTYDRLQIFEKELSTTAGDECVPGEFIVKFKPEVGKKKIDEINLGHGTSIKRAGSHFMRLNVPEGKTVAQMVERYSRNPNVAYAEPNRIAHVLMVPNDHYYPLQWHLDDTADAGDNPYGGANGGGINIEPAWNISTGTGVIVAVIDTGVAYESHMEFVDGPGPMNYWITYAQAPDLANTNFVAGYDFVNGDTHPNDDEGHGTHVTGTIAQSTNNGLGIAGVAFDCFIMPIKVLGSDGSGYYSWIADGIYYAADNGAQVISMSLGGTSTSNVLEDALAYAYEKNVTIVCSAGNGGPDGDPGYPAAYDAYCIAVGATRYDETVSYYSTNGEYVDIAAPGGDIYVDQNGDGYGDGVLQQTHDGSDYMTFGYYFYQGTSMAAPHVSGVAALLISNGVSSPDDVREALQSTAEDKGAIGCDPEYGWGIVDAYAALQWSAGSNNPPVAYNQSVTTDEDTSVSITLSATDVDGDSLTYSIVDIPSNGTVAILDNMATYTPATNYNGADSFTFKANDGTVDSNTATVSITVTPVNDAPVASDQSTTTPEDTSVSITLSATDVDGDSLTYSIVDIPSNGTVAILDNMATYTPATNYNGADSFTFKANDGTVDSNTATVSITVTPATSTTMHVASIDMSLKTAGPNRNAIALVKIVDGAGAPVEGATVSGLWSGVTDDSDSALTGASGEVLLKSNKVRNAPSGTVFTFTVDDVSLAGWTYDPDTGETSDSITVP